ncbi:hypothetical protein V6N11_056629 [Hibiscus sabdariffa]|uniref:Ionotropic glutamate receptor C-terminal domain-containing protein n=1 Tax=Hibiscus sabdariffa TaxID=183260 RepID=A0ABR2T4E4_9ROSI
MAVEKAGTANIGFDISNISSNRVSTDLETLGVSRNGPRLVRELSNINFRGLSGDFHFVNGQLASSVFQIVNVNGNGERRVGFWTPQTGLVKNLSWQNTTANSTSRPKLGPIIWPGDNADSVPKGWEFPTEGKRLRIGIPVKVGFTEFLEVIWDSNSDRAKSVQGYCIDVFDHAMAKMPYPVPYDYIPFATPDWKPAGSYNDLVDQVYYGNYDAVVGDVTIVANRINDDFRGPPTYQVGTSFWFSFSTMVFAHREKVYCGKYTTIKPTFKTDGFGFVFPKGSPIVSDVSSAILNVTQGDEMEQIQNKWFKSDQSCPDVDPIVSSTRLGLDSFWGLFLLAGIASIAALIMFAAMFLYEQRHVLFQFHPETSLWRKVGIMSRIFDQKDLNSHTFKKTEPTYASSHCSVHDVGVDGSSPNTNCPPSPSSMSNRTDCSDFVFIVAQGSNTSSPDYRQGG